MTHSLALALTVLIEGAVGAALAGRRGALVAAAASLLTHPFAFTANRWLPWAFPWRAALIEATVVAVEALAWRALLPAPLRRALGLAALTNAVSFGLGLAVWWLGWTGR
ncbi:MAG: hypothetical protein H6702_06235 [Myxococcales bacterium]|nr:hypothetical protein [Myxococcales bacterium]